MKTAAPLYALMHEPKVVTPGERRVALSFHLSAIDAVKYFAAQQRALAQTHHAPTTKKDGQPWLAVRVVTADSCLSTAHTVAGLRRKIASALTKGQQALIVEHQAATPRPNLLTNEYYKVVMQSAIEFVPLGAEPQRQNSAAKKPVRNLRPRPA